MMSMCTQGSDDSRMRNQVTTTYTDGARVWRHSHVICRRQITSVVKWNHNPLSILTYSSLVWWYGI